MHIHIDAYERRWLTAAAVMLGVFFATLIAGSVLFGVRPAGQGGLVHPQHLEQTIFAEPGVRHMGDNHYEAIIVAQAWSFTPALMTVPAGSEVRFRVTSRDVIHGFYVEHHDVSFELIPGHIAEARVIFDKPGEYKILCSQYCGRAHHAMHATIVVEPDGDEAVAQGD